MANEVSVRGVTKDQLLAAIDMLWALMPAKQTREIEQDEPELYDLCQRVHHNLWHATTHQQRMMRRG